MDIENWIFSGEFCGKGWCYPWKILTYITKRKNFPSKGKFFTE